MVGTFPTLYVGLAVMLLIGDAPDRFKGVDDIGLFNGAFADAGRGDDMTPRCMRGATACVAMAVGTIPRISVLLTHVGEPRDTLNPERGRAALELWASDCLMGRSRTDAFAEPPWEEREETSA
mmetsp:Transcript_111971/g.194154  ORF Transcript_111971/g.194154 Transcript_111971/m.194154 type:complete len:123 (-) Transcript_111971:431-799(-)